MSLQNTQHESLIVGLTNQMMLETCRLCWVMMPVIVRKRMQDKGKILYDMPCLFMKLTFSSAGF